MCDWVSGFSLDFHTSSSFYATLAGATKLVWCKIEKQEVLSHTMHWSTEPQRKKSTMKSQGTHRFTPSKPRKAALSRGEKIRGQALCHTTPSWTALHWMRIVSTSLATSSFSSHRIILHWEPHKCCATPREPYQDTSSCHAWKHRVIKGLKLHWFQHCTTPRHAPWQKVSRTKQSHSVASCLYPPWTGQPVFTEKWKSVLEVVNSLGLPDYLE
jgi:hypothetical protein